MITSEGDVDALTTSVGTEDVKGACDDLLGGTEGVIETDGKNVVLLLLVLLKLLAFKASASAAVWIAALDRGTSVAALDLLKILLDAGALAHFESIIIIVIQNKTAERKLLILESKLLEIPQCHAKPRSKESLTRCLVLICFLEFPKQTKRLFPRFQCLRTAIS